MTKKFCSSVVTPGACVPPITQIFVDDQIQDHDPAPSPYFHTVFEAQLTVHPGYFHLRRLTLASFCFWSILLLSQCSQKFLLGLWPFHDICSQGSFSVLFLSVLSSRD